MTKKITDTLFLFLITFFLFSYFKPELLMMNSIPTGGDTGSHYFTAWFLKNNLLKNYRLSGWCMGNLGGFPILQNYFPLPFLLMCLLSLVIPLTTAFKIITVSGIFLLPATTYFFFKFLKYKYPVPAIGAIFTLPFLFNEGFSIWGGNILSTLAGTFCYSISFSITIFWLGLLYETIMDDKSTIPCSILLALIGFCHGYSLLFAGFSSLFFLLLPGKFKKNFTKLFSIHALAILLMSFYLVPMLVNLPWTTKFGFVWIFKGLGDFMRQLFPLEIVFFVLLSLSAFSILIAKKDYKILFPSWLCLISFLLYMCGYSLNLVDIRFLPFLQFFLVVSGAALFSIDKFNFRTKTYFTIIILICTFSVTEHNEKNIYRWIKDNYKGVENTPLYKNYSEINNFLKHTAGDSRIVYEHSTIHSLAGSIRAYENLPLFSGRPTLEGVYIQGSLSVPFIFYIQSEVSQISSMPLPEYTYSGFNLKRALEHLSLFNVEYYITANIKSERTAEKNLNLEKKFSSGPYTIFKNLKNKNRYVQPVKFKPGFTTEKNYKHLFYNWFRLSDLKTHLIYEKANSQFDKTKFFQVKNNQYKNLPEIKLSATSNLKETIHENEVIIDGAVPGEPLLIKISYHPDWKVEGADKIYLASPSFMMIYPKKSHVKLYFGRCRYNFIGYSLTILGIILVCIICMARLNFSPVLIKNTEFTRKIYNKIIGKLSTIIIAIFLTSIILFLLFNKHDYQVTRFNTALKYYNDNDFSTAEKEFLYLDKNYPGTIISGEALFHLAMIYFKQKKFTKTIITLKKLLEKYPDTGRAAESYYHLGLCYKYSNLNKKAENSFLKVINDFSESTWADLSERYIN